MPLIIKKLTYISTLKTKILFDLEVLLKYKLLIFSSQYTVPWKSILPARFRSRTLTGVGANSTARLISSTQQWEYLSTKYFVYFRVGKCIHCELVNVSTQKFVKILAVYFNHHLYHIFSDIFDFLKAFNEFDITMFTWLFFKIIFSS